MILLWIYNKEPLLELKICLTPSSLDRILTIHLQSFLIRIINFLIGQPRNQPSSEDNGFLD